MLVMRDDGANRREIAGSPETRVNGLATRSLIASRTAITTTSVVFGESFTYARTLTDEKIRLNQL